MSADRDTTRVVRSWLTNGVTVLPDRVLDAVLDKVPATPQRRSWWLAWRSNRMTRVTQYAIAAAAVLVVAVVGYNLLPAKPNSAGGVPTPSPSTLASPSLAPLSPGPSPTTPAGSYRVSQPDITLYPFTMTVPAGWLDNIADPSGASQGGDAFLGSGVVLTTWIVTHVYTDSCHWSGTLAPVSGRSSLVAALTAQVGHDHSAPVETTIGGLPATRIVLTLAKSFDLRTCAAADIVRLWPDPATTPSGPPDESGGWGLTPGETLTAYVLERGGKAMVLMTVQHVDSPAADVAKLEQILSSVRFEVPAASPSTTP